MKNNRLLLRVILVIAAVLVLFLWTRPPRKTEPGDTPPTREAAVNNRANSTAQGPLSPRPALPTPIAKPAKETATSSAGAVRANAGGPAVTLSRFKQWSEQYSTATPEARAAMLNEGGSLALERRQVMKDLIEKNPRAAIDNAVPYRIRKTLPPEIVALLEESVTGRANYTVFSAYPMPGQKLDRSVFRQAAVNGTTYEAYVYGQRLRDRSGKGVALYGVALDGLLAVAENPIRPLDAVEAKDLIAAGKAPTDAICSVSGLKTTVIDAGPAAAAVAAPTVQAGPSVAGTASVEIIGAPQALQTVYGDFGGQILAFCRPTHVARQGRSLATAGATRYFAGGAPSGTTGGGGSPGYTSSQGVKTLLYMRLVFPDDTTVPITEATAYQDLNDLNNHFMASSYNTLSVQGVVTPLLMMPYPKLWYTIPAPAPGSSPATPPKVLGALYAHARAAAAEAGYYFSDYDWDCIRFTTVPGAAWGGLAGGGNVWLQGSGLGVLGHEFGHILGLMHSNLWDTRSGAAPGSPAEVSGVAGHNVPFGAGMSIDYGDPFCIMGVSTPGQFNTKMKWAIGWLPDSAVATFDTTVSLTSNVRLYAMDAPLLLQGRQHAIRIRRTADREYWFQYRTEFPNNPWLMDGVQITASGNTQTGEQNGETDLIDVTPNSALFLTDSALPLGQTYHDPQVNLFLTPVLRTGTGSNAFMDVVVNIGNFPTNIAPVFGTLTTSSNNIGAGDTITLTAAVTDANSDTLAYHWDFGDVSVSTNSPVATHTFTNAGEYVVRCVATDMKGGTASKNLTITVGSPGTFRISGVVRFADFTPVADARVDNGLTGANYGYSITDSQGRFALVNLPNGTYDIGVWRDGYHFEPFNNSPNSITINNVTDSNMVWTATRLPIVSLTTLTSGTEGGNATVVITHTGPTNVAMNVVLITPFGDSIGQNSATVTTDYTQTNGIIVPHTNSLSTNISLLQVTIPAAFSNLTLTFSNVADLVYEGTEYFFVDLADPYQKEFRFSFLNPGITFATNYPRIPGWMQNIEVTPGVGGSYGYLPTSTYIRTDPTYVIGRPNAPTAALRITDADAPTLPGLGVFASGNVALESGYDPGEFVFLTTSVLATDLTVFYTLSGTASNGQDYVFLPGSFVMPSNSTYYLLPVFATNDFFVEGPETIILTITPSPATYTVGTGSATVTLVDDDLPTVSISSLDPIAVEGVGGNTASFTFTRTGNQERSLTINYVVSAPVIGGATSGTDFTTLPGSITIPIGATRATVTLTPIDDLIDEGDETVIVSIVGSVFYNTGSPSSAQANIQDDERNTVTMGATADATEGGSSGSFTINRTGDTSNPLIVFFTVGGSAIGGVGADYNSIGNSVMIPGGAAFVVIPVTAINDSFYEATENVILTLTTNTATYNVSSPFQALVHILDNDSTANPGVGFMTGTSSASESVTTVTIPVYLSALPPFGELVTNGSPARLRVAYGVTGGNATNGGVNYLLANGVLEWRNGTNMGGPKPPAVDIVDELIQNITFSVTDDALVNGSRSLVVTLSNYNELVIYDSTKHSYITRITTTPVPFLDDTTFAAGFGPNGVVRGLHVQPDDTVVAVGDFTAVNSTNAVGAVRFLANGAIDPGFNFAGVDNSIHAVAAQSDGKLIVAGAFTNLGVVQVNRLARLDTTGARDATFLSTGANATNIYAVAVDSTDNIYLGGDFTTVNGSGRSKLARLTSNGSLDGGFTGNFVGFAEVYSIFPLASGNVLVGGDFTNYNGTDVTNLVMLTTGGVIVPGFTFGATVNGPVRAMALNAAATEVVIVGDFTSVNTSNMTRIASLLLADGSINNAFATNPDFGGANASVRAIKRDALGRFYVGGDFTQLGTNTAFQFFGRISAGGSWNVPMHRTNDPNARVRAVALDSTGRVYLGGDFTSQIFPYPNNYSFDIYKSHTYTILDDDVAVVTITAIPSPDGTFQILRTGDTSIPLTVKTDVTGTGTRGSDYELRTNGIVLSVNDVTIPAGTNAAYVTVVAIEDSAEEFEETVVMSITSVPSGRVGNPRTATIYLPDNDGSIQFDFATFGALEGAGVVPITIRRTGNTNVMVTVDYVISNGTAVNGVDFFGTNGTVTFFPGQLTTNFSITLTNDTLVEGSETVNLALANATGGLPLGGQNTATLLIIDDDTAFQFSVTNFLVTEIGGAGNVTVYRLGLNNSTHTVEFTATNGTATNVLDFTGVTNTLTFNTGVTSQIVAVPILDDSLVEGNETITLRLANPSGLTFLGISNTVATLTILDDDAQLSFSSATYSTNEYAAAVVVTVVRTGGTVNTVTVNVNTTNGTATAGLDYFTNFAGLSFTGDVIVNSTNDSGVMITTPGQTSKTFTINLIPDVIGEFNETIFVGLSTLAGGPPGATTLGAIPMATVTLVDNEQSGDTDFEFSSGSGANDSVFALGRQADGRVVVGGAFTTLNGISYNRIGRLTTNGTVDPQFIVNSGASSNILAISVASNDKLIIGGQFTNYIVSARGRVARLNADGSLDTAFLTGTGANDTVRAVLVLTNDQVFIGGDFTDYNGTNVVNGTNVSRLARLNSDGSFDTNFLAAINGPVHTMARQADGKLIIGGAFTSVNGFLITNVARILTNGLLDLSFVATGVSNTVRSLVLQGDEKVIIGGDFHFVEAIARTNLARLLTTGALDTSFAPGTGPDGVILSVAMDANGKLLIGGAFTNYNGSVRTNFARIKSNGQIDPYFRLGQGADATVRAVLPQSDTSMIIGGDFTSVNGIARNRVAKVHGDEVSNISTVEFSAATYVVEEGNGIATVSATIGLVRFGATNQVTTVEVVTTDGTAVHPTHYTGITNVVTFALGERVQSTTVPIINGTDPNTARTINLYLTNAVTGFLDTVTNAVLTVNDNDVVFTFSTNNYAVLENVGMVAIGILRSGSLPHPVSVVFSTTDSTAIAPGDYTAQAAVHVPFGVGVTSNFVTVTVIDDMLPESTEVANLLLNNSVTNNSLLQLPVTLPSAALTITDDDNNPGQFAFSSATYTVTEANTNFTITVVRNGGFVSTNGPSTVDITVRATNGTATHLVDFLAATNTIGFTNFQTTGTITVSVLDDALTNGNRTVNLSLVVTDPTSGATLAAPSTAVLTIFDEDNGPGTFNFAAATFSVGESATNASIVISRSSGSLGVMGLRLTTSDGTALAGLDYTNTVNDFLMLDGQVTTNILVPIIMDDLVEGDQTFNVNLNLTSGAGVLGSLTNAVVTILDDDALIRFVTANTFVSELVPSVTVSVERVGGTNGTVSAQIYREDSSTATAGVDYVNFAATTLTFPPGVTLTNFVVTMIDDFVAEVLFPDELVLGLTNAFPALSTNAFGGTVTNTGVFVERNLFSLNVIDNDSVAGTLTINREANSTPQIVQEGVNSVTLRIRRVGGSAGGISVEWTTTEPGNGRGSSTYSLLNVGSDYAVAGVDYVATGGTLNWADTDATFRDVTVTLLSDDADPVAEFNKDLFILLRNPQNTDSPPGPRPNVAPTTNVTAAGIGGGQYRFTIVDDDQPGGVADRLWNLDNNFGTTPTFNPLPGANNTVQAVVLNAGGLAIVAGDFTAYNAQSANRIARVNTNGSFDATFNPGSGFDSFVTTVAIHTNAAQVGRIVAGGGFTSMNGTSRNGIARLLTTGALDASFNPGAGFNGPVRSVAIQPDGKIVVGGAFTSFNGTGRTNLARLNSDGTLDTAFDPVNGANGTIYAVALSTVSSGIYIGGDFTSYNGTARNRIARLTPSGLLDSTFDPGTGANAVVSTLAVQTDGTVLAGGDFTVVNQFSRSRIVRFTTTGAIDSTFNPGSGANNAISTITLAIIGTNEQAYVAGEFTSYNGSLRKNVLRLYTDGTLDTTFMDQALNTYAGPTNADSFITALAVQTDGDVLIGGSFTGVGAAFSRVNQTSPALSEAGSVPANTNATELAKLRWNQTKPRQNLARLVGRISPGPGNVHFESPSYIVNESAGVAAIRLTRFNGIVGPVLVDFTTGDLTATAGLDYVAQSGVVQWLSTFTNSGGATELRTGETGPLSGVNNSTLFLTLINDNTVEANETIDLILGAVSGSFVLGSNVLVTPAPALGFQSRVTLTIADDEFTPGVLGFSAVSYSAVENSGSAVITVTRTNGTMGTVTVGYFTSTSGSTATAGSDYSPTNGTLTFLAGETSKTFTVRLINDVLVEVDETVSLLLTNVTGGATLGLTNATLTVTDDDFSAGRLSLTAANYGVTEGGASVAVTVVRNGGSVGAASALFYTRDNTALHGVDYTGSTNALTWANGDASSRTLTLAIANNFLVDGTRTVNLTLTNITTALPGSITNATVTIADDDAFGTVTFSTANYSVAENGGQMTITAIRTGGNGGTVTVDFYTDLGFGTAVATVDYLAASGTLTMTPGVASASAVVTVLDNGTASQPNKTVVLRLQNLSVGATFGAVSNATLTIIDDESFNIPAGSVDTTFNTLAGANGFLQTLALQPDGRLLIGGDFTLFNNVARGRLARINADGSLDTTFLLSGSGANASVRTITLQADGRMIVGGTFTNLNATNRSGVARLNNDGTVDSSFNPGAGADNPVYASAIYTSGGNSGKILIGGGFATYNGTPRNSVARLNSDGSLDTSFTIGTGANGTVYAITILADGKVLVGGDFTSFNGVARTAGLARLNADGSVDTLFNPTGPGANASVRAIRVQSDGKLVIGGLFTSFNGAANNFYARLDRDGNVDAAFTTAGAGGADNAVYDIALQDDGKIVLGGDFTRLHTSNGTGGVSRSRVTRLNADGTVDPTINFGTAANGFVGSVVLHRTASNVEQIVLGGGFTTFNGATANYLTRLNGGSLAGAGRLEFTLANYIVSEAGGSVPISVIRTGGTTGTATNTLLAVGGTAINGTNYFLAATNLAFPPGEVIRTVNVTVTNDLVVNLDRTVSLVLSNFVTAVPGNQTNATLTIVNDDTQIGFSSPTYSVNENVVGGFVGITVTRTFSTVGSASADFFTSAGPTNSATAGADYTAVSNVLTFASGESLKTVNIPILEDLLVEGNETVTLTLTNITGAAGITTAILTIVDNDFAPGELNFSANAFSVNEAGGSATITVVRSNGFTGVVSVNYATTGLGTAIAGVDFTPVSGTLAFADGQTSRTFGVPILVNVGSATNTTVSLQVTTPTGGAVVNQGAATLTIVNNDVLFGNFNFTTTAYSAYETNTAAMVGSTFVTLIGVSRDGGNINAVTVSVVLVNGSGTNGIHYNAAVTNVLSWAHAESGIKTFAITNTDNAIINDTRTVTMMLTNVTGGASVGATNTALYSILDDEIAPGEFLFGLPTFTVLENATNAFITILRTNGFTRTNTQVGVTFATSDGTAFNGPGLDYTAVSTNLVFTNGQISVTVLVPISDNTIVGGNKIVNLTLSTPTGGATVQAPASTTLTIIDNDPIAGSVDSGFNPGTGLDGAVYAIGTNASGQLIIAGEFNRYNNLPQTNLARLLSSGALDTSLLVPPIANGASPASLLALAVQPDGKMVIGGQLTSIGGTARQNIARINVDGTLDGTFDPPGGAGSIVNALALQSNGRVLVGGAFTTIAGGSRNFIARLNTNGTLDATFDPGFGANGIVRAVAVDGSGNVLVGGDFTTFNGATQRRLVRLASNGALDGTFNPGANLNGPVNAILVQPDGKLLIGGLFTQYGATARAHVARLNSDGSLDTTFNPGASLNNFVSALGLLVDGRVVAVGGFTAFNGISRNGVVLLTGSGALDPSSNLGTGANSFVAAAQVQNDGKVVLGGGFTSFNGVTVNFLTRINTGVNLGSGTLGFSALNYDIAENAGSITISVVRSAGTSNAVEVAYTTANGTALSPANYSTASGTLTFAEGETLRTFNVSIVDESQPATNAPRTINLLLTTTGGTAPALLGTSVATITIQDRDAQLAFAISDYVISESGNNATITVVRTGSTNGVVTVDFLTVAGGTATAGVDYVPTNGTLTFADGVISQTFGVSILEDTLVEGSETVALVLTNAVGLGNVGAVLGPPATIAATLTINDNDLGPGEIRFSAATYTVAENATSAVITVIRTNGTQNIVSVNYATANGSATAGADYVASAGSLIWASGDNAAKTFTVTILDDTLVEGNETILLTLSGASGGAVVTGPSASLSILDNDDLVQFAATSVAFFESLSNAVLTVQRIGGGNAVVTVDYTTTATGSAVAGTDYTNTFGRLTFNPGVNSLTIVVPISNNRITNAAKTFSVQLGNQTGAILPGPGSVATVTILDDDSLLQFATNAVSVTESAGSVSLTVTRIGQSNSVVSVAFTTGTNGTATNTTDYLPTNGVLVLGTNVTSANITVLLFNDAIVEADETFTVELSAPTGESSLGAFATNTVTILNDDNIVQFAIGTYSVVERLGSITLSVVRTGASNGVVTVPFTSASITAFAGTDFVATNGTLTFETNVVSTNIVVTILNDKLVESGETFTVTLGAPTGESTLGPTNSATITIVDDESTLEFVLTSVSVLESSGVLAVQVSRVGALNSAVTLPFTFINGTATNALDFFGVAGTLNFGSGDSQQTINVAIANDLIVEPTKSFSILLGAPVGEAVLGTRTVMNVTIRDDDSVVQFPSGTLNVAESAQNATITVQRTGATNVAVSANLSTADGLATTATAGVDYGAVTTNLVFAIGENQKSFSVPLTNDSITESTEQFRVLLNSVTGEATRGAISTLTVSIIDDDFRTLIAAGYALVAEGYQPTNNAVDPLETVTVNFSIQNIGNVTSPDITATLLLSGGVMSPSAPQVYTNLTNGALRTMPFTFTAAQVQTVTATLQLQDINGSAGAVTFLIDLGVPSSFSNRTLINIPGTITVPSFGPASPYNNQITVANVSGLVNKVTVQLHGFSHTWPADVDMILVGPAGQKVVLMSDAGSGNSVANLNLTFDDAASSTLPELTTILQGTFRPTDYVPGDSFPAPAPAGPYATTLSAFNGTSPNGVWTLYIVDDTDQHSGTILTGWSLNLSTVSPRINLAATMTSSAATVASLGQVAFTTTITNHGPNTAMGVIYSNAVPAGFSFVSATSSVGSNPTVIGQAVVGTLGPLGTGAVHTVTVRFATSVPGVFTNTAVVFSTGEVELVPADNTASSSVAVGVLFLTGQSLGSGNFSLTLANAVAGRTYVFEGTTDFLTPTANTVWTPVTTNTAAGSTLSVTIPDVGGFLRRFYRAIEQ